MTLPLPPADYPALLAAVKERILQARTSAVRSVNRELIGLYWDIGRVIVDKQQAGGWGDAVVERLARDLRAEFPHLRGFSPRNLWDMRRFYEVYGTGDFLRQAAAETQVVTETLDEPFLRQLVAEVPWGHHQLILSKLQDPAVRLYYLRATAQFGWTRRVLLNQIKAGAYERAVAETKSHNFELALPEHLAEQADEMMKSRYNLEFLGIAGPTRERALEDRLIE